MNVLAIPPLRWIPSLRASLECVGWRCDQIILQFLFSYLCNTNLSWVFFVVVLLADWMFGPNSDDNSNKSDMNCISHNMNEMGELQGSQVNQEYQLQDVVISISETSCHLPQQTWTSYYLGRLRSFLPNSGAVLDFSSHYPYLGLPMARKNRCCNTTYPSWIRLT